MSRILSSRYRSALYIFSLLVILITGIAAYSNTFHSEFIFDDRNTIIENPIIRTLDIPQIWLNSHGRFIGYLSFALSLHFHHLELTGFHITNLVIHLINAMLTAWLILQILSLPAFSGKSIFRKRFIFSFLVSLLFVSHPVQTQAITYIVQRFTSLSALFYLLSLNLYLSARIRQINCNKPQVLIYAGSFLIMILAILTKETSYTIPLVIVMMEILLIRPYPDQSGIWKFRLSYFLVPVGLFLFIFFLYDLTDIFSPKYSYALDDTVTPFTYCISQFGILLSYLKIMVLPLDLVLDHGRPLLHTPWQSAVVMPFLIIIGIICSAILLARRYPLISLGIFWFFITISIESSIIPLADLMVEHRLYLPSIGFFITLIAACYHLFGEQKISVVLILVIILSAGNTVLTWKRNLIWQTAFSVWNDNIEKTPDNPRPYNSRGIEYSIQGKTDLALVDFNHALELNPNYVNALGNRAKHFELNDDMERAVRDYSRIIEVDTENLHQWYYKRSILYNRLKKFDDAIRDITESIQIKPLFLQYYLARGNIQFDKGNTTAALRNYNMALQLNQNFAPAVFERMKTYLFLRDFIKAKQDYERCLELQIPISQDYKQSLEAQFDSFFSSLHEKGNIILMTTYGQDVDLTEYMPAVQELLEGNTAEFKNAFTSSPQYNPAFASLLRGQYIHNFQDTQLDYTGITQSGLEDTTIATLLQNGGFETIFIGQYFSGYDGNYPMREKQKYPGFPFAFDDTAAVRILKGVPPGWNEWHSLKFKNSMNELIFNDNGQINSYVSERTTPAKERYLERINAALDNVSKPFFMWINYISLHDYPQPDPKRLLPDQKIPTIRFEQDLSDKPEYIQQFQSLNPAVAGYSDSDVDVYYRRLVQVTLSINDVLQSIRQKLSDEQIDNTYIIYLSAAGGSISRRYAWQGDLTPYDESLNIPFIISGPGITGHQPYNQIVSLVDILPTIMDISGLSYPWFVDGRSVKQILQNPGLPAADWRHSVLAGLGPILQYRWESMPPGYALFRSADYKYIEYQTGETEYYNLVEDPLEYNNLIPTLTKIQKLQLKDELHKLLQLYSPDKRKKLRINEHNQ